MKEMVCPENETDFRGLSSPLVRFRHGLMGEAHLARSSVGIVAEFVQGNGFVIIFQKLKQGSYIDIFRFL